MPTVREVCWWVSLTTVVLTFFYLLWWFGEPSSSFFPTSGFWRWAVIANFGVTIPGGIFIYRDWQASTK